MLALVVFKIGESNQCLPNLSNTFIMKRNWKDYFLQFSHDKKDVYVQIW